MRMGASVSMPAHTPSVPATGWSRAVAIWAVLTATVVVYWPGLADFQILDDQPNLEPVWRWLAGELGWQQVVFGNLSGPLGRPLSMASFVASAAAFGDSMAAFKAVNLAIHLVCGLILMAVLTRIARLDPVLGRHARWLPLVVAAIWLLHPLHVGTVLYGVQRMTLLSALFASLAVLAYLVGRDDLERGRTRRAFLLLGLGLPGLSLLSALSKENGLLIPLYCALIEWVLFPPRPGARRPLAGRVLVGLLPAAAIVGFGLLVIRPPALFDAFSTLPFGPMERLLTQGPVLVDYATAILLPFVHAPSLFRDDFPLSTGLLSPPWTLGAWFLIAVVVVLAFRARRDAPAIAFGIGWFLVGHAMESSFLPLHLHFEHRNYLPSFGLLVAAAGVICRLAEVAPHTERWRQRVGMGIPLVGVAFVVLAVVAHAQALHWRSPSALLAHTLKHYPDARAARLEAAGQALRQRPPRLDLAQAHYGHLLSLDAPGTRTIGLLGLLDLECTTQGRVDPRLAAATAAADPQVLEPEVVLHYRLAAEALAKAPCEGVSIGDLASAWSRVVEGSGLPPRNPAAITMRQSAALLHRRSGHLDAAIHEARTAWESGRAPLAVGLLLADLKLAAGQVEEAGALITTLDAMAKPDDRQARAAIDALVGLHDRLRAEPAEPASGTARSAPEGQP